MTLSKKAIINICICAVAVVSLLLMFAPYVSTSFMGETDSISGFSAAFGSSTDGTAFAFFPFLVFLFFIAIAVLACLNAFVLKDNKVVTIVIMILAFVSAVLLFFAGMHGFMWKIEDSIFGTGKEQYEASKAMGMTFGPGFGAVLSAILMLVAGAGACANEFVLKD